MREKDFCQYSNSRKGLLPRALILNNGEVIIKELTGEKPHKEVITVVEVGFNHGNDSRYICSLMYEELGNKGWMFHGYDYEKYFMPENIEMDEKQFKGINGCIKAVPFTLQEMAINADILPQKIDFLYSSKTLTLCKKDEFMKIIAGICERISTYGYFVCSLHTKVEENDEFPTYEELLDVITNGYMFKDFSIEIQSNNGECNFAFIAYKNGKHSVSICDQKFINISQNAYRNIANNEQDFIYIE